MMISTFNARRFAGIASAMLLGGTALASTSGTQQILISPQFDLCRLWTLPTYRQINNVTREQFRRQWKRVMLGTTPPPVPVASVAVYRLSYESADANGAPARVSGMVAVPTGGAPKGMVLYYHCTTSVRDNVPSRYKGDAEPAIFAFASAGYAVVAPDYLGHGDHGGTQPYALGSITARSGIDMIEPARLLADREGRSIGPSLFVTGYSEGGAAAMWATKLMQESHNPLHKVTRSAPMSGPYDLSDTQAKSMLANHSNAKWLGSIAYLAAYAAYGMEQNDMGVEVKDLFVSDFASYVPHVFKGKRDDYGRAADLAWKGAQYRQFDSLGAILKPDFRIALQNRDVKHPFVKYLAKEDCYDWKPESPMWLYCVGDDFIVSRKSTHRAIQEMRREGTPHDMARMFVDKGRRYCHMKGQYPGLLGARAFFDGGFDAVPYTCEFTGKQYKANAAL